MRAVAIVGSHRKTRDQVPWNNKEIDIWVFNESASLGWPQKVDAVFQMHAEPVWKNPLNRNDPKFPKWMRRKHIYPIWMLDHYSEVPASQKYPLEEICAEFLPGLRKGEASKRYFTSSVSFALALALFQNYERIELYGVEMESDTEYRYQRDGVFFWLGIALGHGVEIFIPEASNLFKEPVYGYEGGAYLGREQLEKRKELLVEKQKEVQEELDKANQMQISALDSAMDESGGDPGMAAVATTKQYLISIKAQTDAIVKAGMFKGALDEVDRYVLKCDKMEKESGTHMLARQEFELTAANASEVQKGRKSQLDVLGVEARAAWKAMEEAVKNDGEQKHLMELSANYGDAHKAYLESAFEFGRLEGVVKENFTLLTMVDELVKAAGGYKAEAALVESGKKKRRHRRSKVKIEEIVNG